MLYLSNNHVCMCRQERRRGLKPRHPRLPPTAAPTCNICIWRQLEHIIHIVYCNYTSLSCTRARRHVALTWRRSRVRLCGRETCVLWQCVCLSRSQARVTTSLVRGDVIAYVFAREMRILYQCVRLTRAHGRVDDCWLGVVDAAASFVRHVAAHRTRYRVVI